jgi:ATP-dependent exoDNAse (exonuclease V) alpha subunit
MQIGTEMPVITPKTEELIGEFSHEKVARGAGDSPERWIVGELRNGQMVVGNAKAGSLCMGERYRFLGAVKIHDQYGRQFAFSSFCHVEPTDLQAIIRYLQKARGIGPKAATRIVAEFKEEALETVRTNPSLVAERCRLNEAAVEAASQFFCQRKALERITIEVEGLLANRGFPRSLPQKVIEKWGERACEVIRENPYVLRLFSGIGFLLCDRLYEALGLPMDALIRQSHCVLHALESDSSGSTWLGEDVIQEELRAKIAGARLRIREAISDSIERGMIRERAEVLGSSTNQDSSNRPARKLFYAVTALADSESSWVSDVHRAVHELDDSFGLAGEAKW